MVFPVVMVIAAAVKTVVVVCSVVEVIRDTGGGPCLLENTRKYEDWSSSTCRSRRESTAGPTAGITASPSASKICGGV